MEQRSTTIFINPKFKNAYINPNFLLGATTNSTIHVNPKFLNQQVPTIQPPLPPPPPKVPEPPPLIVKSAIIKNTKRSLIRAPEKVESTTPVQEHPAIVTKKMNLIKISNTKLVNASHLMTKQQKENETIKKATESLIKAKKFQQKKANSEQSSIYKLDHRKDSEAVSSKKKKKIIKQFSIKNVDQPNTPKKVKPTTPSSSGRKLLRMYAEIFISVITLLLLLLFQGQQFSAT